jgi:Tol biopolymer transport system component
MNSRFSDRLARLADEAVPPEPDIPALERLTRRRRVRRRVGAGIAVPVIALAVVLPVRALMRLGEDVVGGPPGPGELIAFSKQVDDDRYEIWLVRSDGSGAERIDIPLPMATDPAWSPDGTTIAFSGIDETNTEPNDIYVVNPDGTGFRELTNAPEWVLNMDPSWSPDGTHLVFSRLDGREESGSGHTQLVILDLEEGDEETVSLPDDFYQAVDPVWSPDGSRVAFTANRDGIAGPYIVDVATGELVKLVPDRHAGSDVARSPSWSPDGTRIAFEDDGDIFTVSLGDMTVAQLTHSPAMETAPNWSPDGRIVFLSGASRPLEPCTWPEDAPDADERCAHEVELQRLNIRDLDVYVMNADGSGQVQITSGGGVGYSPDGPAAPSWRPVAAEPTISQPTAESIMQTGGPVGKELADALGLELQSGFNGDCSFYVEINDSHEGYCLEGLAGDNHAKQWVIGEALRGRVVTDAELAKVEETLG